MYQHIGLATNVTSNLMLSLTTVKSLGSKTSELAVEVDTKCFVSEAIFIKYYPH